MICEVTKLGSADQVQVHKDSLLEIAQTLGRNDTLTGNTVIRKLHAKLIARIAIRLLPAQIRRLRAKGQPSSDASTCSCLTELIRSCVGVGRCYWDGGYHRR